jgi:hypothetical protein
MIDGIVALVPEQLATVLRSFTIIIVAVTKVSCFFVLVFTL